MEVAAIDVGYAGLATGACLSEMGNEVVCPDLAEDKIRRLNNGDFQSTNPGCRHWFKGIQQAGGRHSPPMRPWLVGHDNLQFIGVGTLPGKDGSADRQNGVAVARSLGRCMTDYKVIVDKSTLPKAAADKVRAVVQTVWADRDAAQYGEDLAGRTFALLGLAFKPNTDDKREAPCRVVVGELLRRGACIPAYDLVARPEAQRMFGELPGLRYGSDPVNALAVADALLVATGGRQFKRPVFEQMRAKLKQPLVFEGRNRSALALMRVLGIDYRPIGRVDGVKNMAPRLAAQAATL